MLHLGVYLMRNLVKIPFHELVCSGISAKGKALGGHRKKLPDRAAWELEEGSSWDKVKGSVIYQSKVGNEAVKGVS